MRFPVLYVDPPWSYKVYSKKGEGRSAENHYHTMSAEDIYSLDVAGIADKDCVLFLWVTFPCLLEGLEAIRRWGFTYKTLGFCWVKRCKKQREKWFWGLGLASGFSYCYTSKGGSWNQPGRPRTDKAPVCPKHLYEIILNRREDINCRMS